MSQLLTSAHEHFKITAHDHFDFRGRILMRFTIQFILALATLFLLSIVEAGEPLPNILIITVDDMNCDSVGAFGCKLLETTPNIDKFAEEGMRFEHAHVQVGNCFPSRNVLLSGRYPHNTGVEGFYQVRNPGYPHLVDLMQKAGYFVGIRGKASHSTPYQPYHWDADLSVLDGQKQDIKNANSYYRSTRRGIELAQNAKKPFCLNVNISDPHKPFYAMGNNGRVVEDSNVPSRIFTPDEVPIPGFLFDHPDVRKELAHYYSSVRRADDCFAQIMKALEESGMKDETIIVFLSDHGMPLPFAKTALWHHSTRTPWIVRYPGVTEDGSVDKEHMISAVDLVPTLLDILNLDEPAGLDGKSFLPLLHGDNQADREMVYKVYNENSGGNRSPMRSVESKRFGYIFNPWSDGKRIFRTATTGTMTYRAMVKLAPENEKIAARLEFFQHGVPEEFYDYENDPDALHNLVDDPDYKDELNRHRAAMLKFMKTSNDPILEVFKKRSDAQFVSDYVDRVQAESDERRKSRQGRQKSPKERNKYSKLFRMELPETAAVGTQFEVVLAHSLPTELKTQQFHVTLRDADGKRIERKVVNGTGRGRMTISFDLPKDQTAKGYVVSAFVGQDYPTNLLHLTEGPVFLGK